MGYLMSIVTSLIDARIDLCVVQNVGHTRQIGKLHNKIICLLITTESTFFDYPWGRTKIEKTAPADPSNARLEDEAN